MQDIFVSQRNLLLENWLEAFPHAKLCEDNALKQLPHDQRYLFWLHNNVDRKQWLMKTIAFISEHFTNSPIVVLANVPDQIDAMDVIGTGANGYCHAYSDPELLGEVRMVIEHGGIWLGRDFLTRMIHATKPLVKNNANEQKRALSLLSDREREVALEAAKGLSNKEIAQVLNITERTVKAHLSAIFEKLDLRDRVQLALILKSS